MSEAEIPDNTDKVVSPGNELKKAREAAGVSLQAISDATLISLARLNALEADNYKEVGSPTYVTGYARAYAKVIGYDAQELIDQFEEALGFNRNAPVVREIPEAQPRKPLFAILLATGAALTIVVVGLILLFTSSGADDDATKPSGQPQSPPAYELEPKNIAQLPEGAVESSMAELSAAEPNAVNENAMEIGTANNLDTNANEESGLARVNSSEPLRRNNLTSQPVRNTVAAESIQPSAESFLASEASIHLSAQESITDGSALDDSIVENEVLPAEGELHINFTDVCWLRIIDASGKRLADITKQAGQTLHVKGVPPFYVKFGNVEAVATMQFNGDSVPVVARPGFRTLELSVGR